MLEKVKPFVLLGMAVLVACSYQNRIKPGTLSKEPVHYSLVFIIHGDGSYIYHDIRGNTYRADEQALEQAHRVADSLRDAEVFIFHQKPKKSFLVLFPQKDGQAYYYRNGKLFIHQPYFWTRSDSILGFESQFFAKHSRLSKQGRRLLFYYGHQIPEFEPHIYHRSHRKPFSIDLFRQGLTSLFKKGKQRDNNIDGIILSTCHGGTPAVLYALSPLSHLLLASPGTLHLSHIDSEPMISLLHQKSNGFKRMMHRFSRQVFINLTKRTETPVSLVLYDTNQFEFKLDSLMTAYTDRQKVFNQRPVRCIDCETDPKIKPYLPSKGVTVFFRPSQFGKSKHKKQHSGWGCWVPEDRSLTPPP